MPTKRTSPPGDLRKRVAVPGHPGVFQRGPLKVYVHPTLHDAPDFVDGLLAGESGNASGNTPPESRATSGAPEAAETA
jgi:hypothetical protein